MSDFDTLWNYSKPAETEAKFRKLLPNYNSQPALKAELLTQIARTYSLRGSFDTAHQTLDEANKLIGDEKNKARIRYWLERGRAFNSAGQKNKATPLFEQAWELSRKTKEDYFAVDAAHMLAIAAPFEEQMQWHKEAISYAEQSEDKRTRNWLGSLYNNLGWTLYDENKLDEALDIFKKALAFRQTQGQDQPVRIAKWCIAKCLRSLGQVNEALEQQKQLEREYQKINETNGYVFEEIGECLVMLNQLTEAKPYFHKAYEILSQDKWLQRNEQARLDRLEALA